MRHERMDAHQPAGEMPAGNATGTNAPLLERDGLEVLDLQRYIPFLISAIGNKWSRSSSKIYLDVFGIGVTEWRIMAMLAIEPKITAYRICQVIGLDKGAASRGLRTLEKDGHVRSWQEDPANHRKLLELTDKGRAMHEQIIRLAHQREAMLVADLTAKEVEELAGLLRRVLTRVPDITSLGDHSGRSAEE